MPCWGTFTAIEIKTNFVGIGISILVITSFNVQTVPGFMYKVLFWRVCCFINLLLVSRCQGRVKCNNRKSNDDNNNNHSTNNNNDNNNKKLQMNKQMVMIVPGCYNYFLLSRFKMMICVNFLLDQTM